MKLKILAFIVLTIFFAGCTQKKQVAEKPIISVSILPQKYFTEKIVGNHFHINVLVPPGASPASYEPTPKQMVDLSNSLVYFKIGYIGFELNWINSMGADFPEVKFIDTSEGIEFSESEETHGDHKHHRIEPHIWMSPKNAKVISANILKSILEMDPKNADLYNSNYNIFINEIDSVNQIIENKLKNIGSKDFIIYHPALTYFAKDYGLNQYALEIDGKEPSAKQMQELINLAYEQNIKIIFVQKQFNQGEAKTLEKEINGKVVSIDPLDYNWDTQILRITDILGEALK